MSIGDRLKQWRANKYLKQDEASAQLGIPFSTYQKYEMDNRSPGADALEKIARVGININWLLTGEGDMLRNSPPNGDVGVSARPTFPQVEGDRRKPIEIPKGMVLPADTSYSQGERVPPDPNAPPVDTDVLEICILFVFRQNEKNRVSMTPKELADAVLKAYQVVTVEKEKEAESFDRAQTIIKNLVKSM